MANYTRSKVFNGHIKECPCENCNYKCCHFSNNYIVLYPGELESAKKTDHFNVIDRNYLGGCKVQCVRFCEEPDYKPFDCKAYPLFPLGPKVDRNMNTYLVGIKCPLPEEVLKRHAIMVKQMTIELLKKDPSLADFFAKVEMIGYEIKVIK